MGSVFVLDSHSKESLTAIRSLGVRGLRVTAASPSRWNAGHFSKHVDRCLTYPSPEEDCEEFLRTIQTEVRESDHDMLLPLYEGTVETIVMHRSRFEPYTNVPFPSYERLRTGLDKRRTIEAARKFDIPHPKTYFSDDPSVEAIEEILDYPVVAKPSRGAGRHLVSVCDSREKLEEIIQSSRGKDYSMLFQEFIPNGGERGVYTLYNWSGELAAVTVQQRLRSNPPEGGPSTYRETVEDPDLVSLCDGFLTAIDWRGLAMVEFRFDSRTGEPKLMEINPRFWGSLALSVYAGVDFPYLLYRLAVENELDPDLNYRVGVQARNLFADFWQVLRREDRLTAIREFLTPATKPCRYDIVSLSDPFPVLGHISYGGNMLLKEWRGGASNLA